MEGEGQLTRMRGRVGEVSTPARARPSGWGGTGSRRQSCPDPAQMDGPAANALDHVFDSSQDSRRTISRVSEAQSLARGVGRATGQGFV